MTTFSKPMFSLSWQGKCECQSNAEDGFWYGQYCERQNECEEDADCGTHGLCIDTEVILFDCELLDWCACMSHLLLSLTYARHARRH